MPRRRSLPKDDGERPVIMPNVLDRQFAAARPDQKWVPILPIYRRLRAGSMWPS